MIRVIAPLVLVVVLVYILYAATSDYDYFDRRALKRHRKAYLKKNPDHSKNEPIVWTCMCSHYDINHGRTGCLNDRCNCTLSSRAVRERYQ